MIRAAGIRQWKAELGLLRLSELPPDRIIKARDKLMKREGMNGPVSAATVNRYHAAFAHALTVAERRKPVCRRMPDPLPSGGDLRIHGPLKKFPIPAARLI